MKYRINFWHKQKMQKSNFNRALKFEMPQRDYLKGVLSKLNKKVTGRLFVYKPTNFKFKVDFTNLRYDHSLSKLLGVIKLFDALYQQYMIKGLLRL
jgi:hypothetical protein